jgi:alkyl hydroperoxide reductase 1
LLTTQNSYVPPSPETSDITSCGLPIQYAASKEFANKKVVLFSVPGAFTPSCSAKHLPGFIEKLPALKEKGVDVVAVIAFNDPFVMSAWGKANQIKNEDIVGRVTFLFRPGFSFGFWERG